MRLWVEPPRVPADLQAVVRGLTGPDDLVLYVPYDPAAASANKTRGRHWKKLDEEAQKAHLAAAWAWCEAGQPKIDAPVVVTVLVFRGEALDADNALSGLKATIDFLFKGRVVPDDGPRWVEYGGIRVIAGERWRGNRSWSVLVVRKRGTE